MRCLTPALLALCACVEPLTSPILDVPATESWSLPGLTTTAHVVRVEGSVPHIYAGDRLDLARVAGFVQARDRYFEMEMARRLGLGTLSELLGDAALGTDMESRGNGMTGIVDQMLERSSPESLALLGAFAEGVNGYIAAVKDGDLPPPSEFDVAYALLGRQAPEELFADWDTRAVMGVFGTVLYNLGYETGDVGRQRTEDALAVLSEDRAFGAQRKAGAIRDIWQRIEPVYPISSSSGWGLNTAGQRRAATPPAPLRPSGLPGALLDRTIARNDRLQRRLGHDWEHGWGSNAWAVTGAASADGRALLAGDGHLPLTVPPLFYSIGLHSLDPEARFSQVGLVIPGTPMLAVGTNGDVAWSQTQLLGDITDWYAEELRLDDDGQPEASLFRGEYRPLVRHEETFQIANVPVLGSTGRTETWARWVTFDGRWIADIEGRSARANETLAEGEALVNLQGDLVVPEDLNGDGKISALSFDYVGFDIVDMLTAVDGFGRAKDVWAFREATRGLLAYSQNIVAADRHGSVLYTGYQAVPCRGYLRDAGGAWKPGADPSKLLDGTTYGGFTIPTHADGTVDESFASDPYRCVVPFEDYPHAIDPAWGFVQSANNDPADISTDGDLLDDPHYIGGPWMEGYRAKRIDERLAAAIDAGAADLDEMVDLQADHYSVLAEQLLPELLDAIAKAKAAATARAAPPSADQRMAAIYLDDADAYDEVAERLAAWQTAGLWARSGVETFYSPVEEGDPASAVATMLFNAWVGRYMRGVFDDEGLPGVWQPTGDTGRLRALTFLLAGRGEGNPLDQASWIDVHGESAFFDDLRTPDVVERSDEIALIAMRDALAFLRAAPSDDGRGGFGTDDMDAWLWGLRHWVRFDSVLAEFLGSDPTYAFLTDQFAISPERIPLAGELADLPGFPRHGDHLNVDAGNSGLSGERFSYGSGPVFRMVFALGPDGVEGRNMLPGGQSGLNDSQHFDDQAALWLGNQTWPTRLTPVEVAEGATHRETFAPGGTR